MPWLLAPLFALAPIAGCALAGKVRESALTLPAGKAAERPVPPTVTFDDPAVTSGGHVPVTPVVPAGR